jgi:hypothetical protein
LDQPPEEKAGDRVFTLVEAALSAVPIVGGPFAVIMEAIGGTLKRRKEHWYRDLASVISELEKKVELLSKPLSENEAFTDAVLRATQIALSSNQAEKLQALRNAVKNSARLGAPGGSVQLMFLRFVDELTPWHLNVLSLFENPKKRIAECDRPLTPTSASGILHLIYYYIPELNGQYQLVEQIWRELHARGLMENVSLSIAMTEAGVYTPRITDFGRQFLTFVQ